MFTNKWTSTAKTWINRLHIRNTGKLSWRPHNTDNQFWWPILREFFGLRARWKVVKDRNKSVRRRAKWRWARLRLSWPSREVIEGQRWSQRGRFTPKNQLFKIGIDSVSQCSCKSACRLTVAVNFNDWFTFSVCISTSWKMRTSFGTVWYWQRLNQLHKQPG